MNQTTVEPPSNLKRMVALGMMAVLLLIWLFGCQRWTVPVVLMDLLPGLLWVGNHFGAVWTIAIVDFVCAAGIVAAAVPVGLVILARVTRERSLLSLLFAAAVGFWVLAVAVLLVGVFSVKAVPVVWMLGLLWVAPGGRAYPGIHFRCSGGSVSRRLFMKFNGSALHRSATRPVSGHSARGEREKLSRWEWFMVAVLVVAGVLNVLGAVTPPFEYDALEYHLGSLADYQRAGRIVFLPHNFYSNLPQLTEMLYLLGLRSAGDGVAKWLHLFFGAGTALAVFAVGKRVWSRPVGLTAAVMFFCMPFVQDLSRTARIDLATTFFGTLALAGVLLWRKEEGKEWLWMGAMAAGCAVATKWTAVPVVVLPCFILIAAETRYFKLPAVFGLLASVFVLPWLIKNFFLTGNPVYPLLDHLFESPHWGLAQSALFAEKHFAKWDQSVCEGPWRALMAEPGAVPVGVMCAPLAWLVWRGDRQVRRAGWLGILAFAGWMVLTFRPWRFLFPAVPVILLAGAAGLFSAGRWCRWLLGFVMGVGLCWTGVSVLLDVEEPERVPAGVSVAGLGLGQVGREEFLRRLGAGTFEPIFWMNENLPASATVAYVGEARVFYARHRALWCTAYDRHPLAAVWRKPTEPELLYKGLKAAGVTHVYVNFSEWERLRKGYGFLLGMDSGAFRRMLQEPAFVHPVFERGSKVVWELK
jgi:hypothetical protein